MGYAFEIDNRNTEEINRLSLQVEAHVLALIYADGEEERLHRHSFVEWACDCELTLSKEAALYLWDDHKDSSSQLWEAFIADVVREKVKEFSHEELLDLFRAVVSGLPPEDTMRSSFILE